MSYTSDNPMFRDLTDDEEQAFREYADAHDPDPRSWELMHPISRDQWRKRGFDFDTTS